MIDDVCRRVSWNGLAKTLIFNWARPIAVCKESKEDRLEHCNGGAVR